MRTEAMALKSKVTVNLQYNATGVNALPNTPPAPPPANLKGAANRPATPASFQCPTARLRTVARTDESVVRSAQSLPRFPQALDLPQMPPALEAPLLLKPNVSSEAEQVAKLLTGQSVAQTLTAQPTTIPTVPAGLAAAATAARSALSSPGQVPPIVVTPSPIVVVSPPPTDPKKKHQHNKSRMQQMFNRLGNRISQAVPQ